MKLNYLPIEKSKNKTDSFIIELDNDNYIFEFYYNQLGEYFAFNLYDVDQKPIILGKKIVYNQNILEGVIDKRIPNVEIIPADVTAENNQITYGNLMESVKCYILPGDN